MPRRDVAGLLAAAATRLTVAGVEAPRRDAALLIGHALGRDRGWVLTHGDHQPDVEGCAAANRLIDRRAMREPVSRILGRREFWSLDFTLDAATLDPRPDSETLVAAALELIPDVTRAWRILDLGTGTGCLLLALLSERPNAWGVGLDLAPAALRVARDNARRLGLADRLALVAADWGKPLNGQFDLVLSNPPYIAEAELAGLAPEVTRWDPRTALVAGADGLDAYRSILPALPRLLRPDGAAVLEIGRDQAEAVRGLAASQGMENPRIRADLAGRPRCAIMGGGKKTLGVAGGAL